MITSGNKKYAFIKDDFIDRKVYRDASQNIKHQIVTRELSSAVTKFQSI